MGPGLLGLRQEGLGVWTPGPMTLEASQGWVFGFGGSGPGVEGSEERRGQETGHTLGVCVLSVRAAMKRRHRKAVGAGGSGGGGGWSGEGADVRLDSLGVIGSSKD